MSGLVVGIPAAILQLVQEGLLERAFHDGLFPQMLYRAEAMREEWPANSGEEVFMTRPGLLAPVTKPLKPGVDPLPQQVTYEQWSATLGRYGSSIDTHIPSARVSLADTFMRNVHQLGLQAGQSMNRLPRNELFKAYSAGHTVLLAAAGASDTTIRVAALNGFTEVVVLGSNVRPKIVSSASPLPITIDGIGVRNVIGFAPDDPDDPFGPGTLQLSAAIGGAGALVRTAVLSSARSRLVRSGGGLSVDALSANDTFTLQDAINACALLRNNNVPCHEDGFYHAHISALANAQVFADPVFQRLNQSLPEGMTYREGFLGSISNILFFMNNESPNDQNSGALVATGNNAAYGSDIGSEVINEAGVKVGRILITGKGSIYERYFDESGNVTEAGLAGKVGEFDVQNNGLSINTELIRLYLRAPMDRLGDIVSATWSISTSFPVPSDQSSGGPERYKRAIILEHAL